MATAQITKTVVDNLAKYDFIVLNYACPDMVGHTGNLRAAIKACEAVDAGLKTINDAVAKLNGVLIITADHGNVEQMVNPKNGEPDTEHTNNPVPFLIVGNSALNWHVKPEGELSDVAPTICDILSLQPSAEMTGQSLLIKNQDAVPAPVDATTVPVAQGV